MKQFLAIFIMSLICAVSAQSFAADSAPATVKRTKVIDFEGDWVEGVNKRPLDSFQQISQANQRRKRQHLYHVRASFRSEGEQTIKEIGENQ